MTKENEIKLNGAKLIIKGKEFTLTIEELLKLSDEIAKIIPPKQYFYPVYTGPVLPYLSPTPPVTCKPTVTMSYCSTTSTKLK